MKTLKAWHAVRAKERQLAALQTSGKRGGKVMADSPEPIDEGTARDHAAKAVGVGAALLQIADAAAGRKATHCGKPLPDQRLVIELGHEKGGPAAAASGC